MITLSDAANTATGIYSVGEVARYLGIRSNTLRHWFFPTDSRKPLLKSGIGKSKEAGTWLTFDDFLQAYAVKLLKAANVNPREVREAILEAREKYGLPYPISMKGHTIYADNHGTVHILPAGKENPHQLTGIGKGQQSFQAVVDKYMSRMEFNQQGMAARFIVWEQSMNSGNRRVVMDPHENFGEPTVEGTPYRALTLYNAEKAEGSAEAVARIYDVPVDCVLLAIDAVKSAPELRSAA